MDKEEFWLTMKYLAAILAASGLVLGGGGYTSYKYGRHTERVLLTSYFVQMTQDTYYDGYRDGFKSGEASVKCPTIQEDDEDGRY